MVKLLLLLWRCSFLISIFLLILFFILKYFNLSKSWCNRVMDWFCIGLASFIVMSIVAVCIELSVTTIISELTEIYESLP